MKKTILLTLIFFVAMITHAQTWTGTTGTDWNTPDNWSPSGVPSTTANVIIPGGATNYPKLTAVVTVNTLTMQTGSKLDVNGFVFNIDAVNGYTSVVGATISNSDETKDIIFNVNTGINGYNASFSKDTITDHITFNVTGLNNFNEGQEASKFLFNATYNFANSGTSYLSYQGNSLYSGNLTVNRTSAGPTEMFTGGGTVLGNFSYSNALTGSSTIGNQGIGTTNITGTVNVNVNLTSSSPFNLYRIKNQTSGGTINVKNSAGFDVRNDTLKLASLNIEEYKTPYAYLLNNDISVTGQLKISDDATYGAGYSTVVNNNVFNGATFFFINGTNSFFEVSGVNAANVYNGPATFNATNSGSLYLGYISGSVFNNGVTVNRTAAGETNIFTSGNATVTGNLNYTNLAGGNSTLGRMDIGSYISGTININTNNISNGYFKLYRLINQASGGIVSINKSFGVDIRFDTLKLSSFTVAGYINGYTQLYYNNIIAPSINVSDDATYGNGYNTSVGENTFTGTSNFTINGTNAFWEAVGGANSGNTYNGNTNFNGAGTGTFTVGYSASSTYNGNVTINRTVPATGSYFTNGAIISGNLSYTNNVGGSSTTIGSLSAKTSIGGTINITANNPAQGRFEILRLINQTSGGNILIQNTSETTIQNDTLKINSFAISGYRNGYGRIFNNSITGNFNFSDDATNGGGYNAISRGNIITGNTNYTINGTNNFYDADNDAINKYNGNVNYNRVGTGVISLGNSIYASEYSQDLIINSSAGISIAQVKFTGNNNGILQQTGTQFLSIPKISMAKSGTGRITLNSPLTVTDSLFFGTGNIYTTATNILDFADNSVQKGSNTISHIVGPVTKTGNDAFTFPVGAANSIDSVSMTAPANITDRFRAEYFYANPTASGYDTAQRAGTLKRVSGCEYWDVQREAGTSNVSLTFAYDGTCTGGGAYVNTPAAVRVAHWSGSSWEDLGNGGFSGTVTGTVKTAAPVSSFSPFSIATTDVILNPLPLKLILFKGFRQGGKIMLTWQTETEVGLSRYELEKSVDGARFEFMEQFTAANRGGLKNYTGIDQAPVKGFNFYRLKQIDKDGSYTYSNVVKVNFDGKLTISISPNPVKDKLVIGEAVPGDVIRIFDIAGKLLQSHQVRSVNESINVAGLPVGVYALQLSNNKSLQTIQFIKQ